MDDNHTHSPRDIGAADDHDLTMLERRVGRTESDTADLEEEVTQLRHRTERLEADLAETHQILHQSLTACEVLAEQVTGLAGAVASMTEVML